MLGAALFALGAAAPATDDADELALAKAVVAFERLCVECHGADAAKGGLRLHDAEGWMTSVAPGSVEDSELLYRLMVPDDDLDVMPPEGPRLEAAEVDAVKAWVLAGADVDVLEAAMARAASAGSAAKERAALLARVSDATGARIDSLGPKADPTGVAVSWSHRPVRLTPERLRALEPLAGEVLELGLAGVDFDPAILRALPELPRLVKAHLERTRVDDAAVELLLAKAPALADLNLHSTRVSAAAARLTERHPRLARVVLFATAAAPPPPDPFADVPARQPRRILAADASKGRVALLRETALGKPELLWERETRGLHDLQWLGDTTAGHGRALVQETWTRVVEVDTATGEVLWSYDATPEAGERVEIHSFRRLADGTTMVAESGRGRVVFVDAAGAIVHSFPLVLDHPHPHRDTRLVRPTPAGTFLVAHEGDGMLREYTRDGEVVWTYDVPLFGKEPAGGHGFEAWGDQAFGALRLTGGDTLVTTGNGHGLLRVSPAGEVLWRIEQDTLEGVRLAWTTTIQELTNGHLVLGNCHAGEDQPQAIELDPATGAVLWRFHDFDRFGNSLSNLEVIERTR